MAASSPSTQTRSTVSRPTTPSPSRSSPEQRWRRRLAGRYPLLAAVGLLAAALALIVHATGALHGLDLNTVDARFHVRGTQKPRQPIVIVGVDQHTLHSLRMAPGVLPRTMHAQLISRLHRDGARLIAYDIQFVGQKDPAGDAALTRAISAARPVLLATHDTSEGPLPVPAGRNPASLGAKVGSVGVQTDQDGVIRRMLYAPVSLENFDVRAAEVLLGRKVSQSNFPGNMAWIDYAGGPGTYPLVSFSDAVAGNVPASTFRGKIVVVGYTDPVFFDIVQTPTSSSPMSGPELHANQIETILDGFPLRSAAGWENVLLIIVLTLVPVLLAARLPGLYVLGAAILLCVAFLVGAQLAFNGGRIVTVTDPLLGLVLGTGGSVAVDAFIERRQRKRLEEALGRLLPKPAAFFISYRRDDTRWPANTLRAELVERFGEPSVFMDTSTITPGQEWPARIEQAIRGCSAMLVLIGPHWMGADEHGRRRIDDPEDWVRRELEMVLKRSEVAVVPLLIEGAKMPAVRELPETLQPLTHRHAIALTAERYTAEVDELVSAIERGLIQDYVSRGQGAPVVTVGEHGEPSRSFKIEDEMVIGRGESADIRLKDEAIAAIHARVWPTAEGLMVADLYTEAGTSVDGARIDKPHLITRNATITVGATKLQVEFDSADSVGQTVGASPLALQG